MTTVSRTNKPIRVAISGAAGRIGYSSVFRIAAGGMFGPNQPVSLALLELPEARNRLEACAMELKDCAFPLLTELKVGTDSRPAFDGADWIILLGGKPFSTELANRLDLLRDNAPAMMEQGRAINQLAPEARVLVVAQPCNTNCLIAKSQAPSVPPEHWFALNQLSLLRAVGMISEKTGAPVSQISRVVVWGNNSKTAYIDLRNARIGEKPALEVIGDPSWAREIMEPHVVKRDREILAVRGSTPAGAVAQAILLTIRSITTPTPFGRWFPAGVISDGSYGVPRGLVFGFPLVTPDGQRWSIVDGLYVDETARDRIAANVAELEHEVTAVSHLLGNI
jgi:malate dehydrogenase